jgi:hypothetical protein
MLHIFKKKLRNYLTNSQKITISDEFVKKNSLPTKIVGIEHMSIKTLIKIECTSKDLKLALFPEKKKVGLAVRLLNHIEARL